MSAWRQLRAIVLLPGTVTVAIPVVILIAGQGPELGWGYDGVAAAAVLAAGIALLVAGLGLWGWCVLLFARIGRGTLAPWDPTSNLVAAGPYRWSRNPMISGVVAILAGEAVLFGSAGIAVEALAFLAINHAWFVLVEEPGLERRFGEDYLRYKRAVPRWLPRPPR